MIILDNNTLIQSQTNQMVTHEDINFKIIFRNKFINFYELNKKNISTIKELKDALVIYFKTEYNTIIFPKNIVLSKQFVILHDKENIKILDNTIILLTIIPIICNDH